MATKQSSPEMSSLAARVLGGYAPTPEEIRSLAASVLSQDETPDDRSNPMVAETKRLLTANDPAEEREADAAPVQNIEDLLGR